MKTLWKRLLPLALVMCLLAGCGQTAAPAGEGTETALYTEDVTLEEVDPDTMESKLVPGLYFAGEILNYDGPCGGFNLHFAWDSGIRAGKAMAAAALGADQ